MIERTCLHIMNINGVVQDKIEKDRKVERKEDRKTERQKDRKTDRVAYLHIMNINGVQEKIEFTIELIKINLKIIASVKLLLAFEDIYVAFFGF
jgi:hypothetical protein